MKKLFKVILAAFVLVIVFVIGFLIRQPQVNKLKKQLEVLQKDNSRLLDMIRSKQAEYQELLLQHQALKALQFRKKAKSNEKLSRNLIMQYAIYEYISLLIKGGRYGKKMTNEEKAFYKAFQNVIDGKQVSDFDKENIKYFIKKRHNSDIETLKECDFAVVFHELQKNYIATDTESSNLITSAYDEKKNI